MNKTAKQKGKRKQAVIYPLHYTKPMTVDMRTPWQALNSLACRASLRGSLGNKQTDE